MKTFVLDIETEPNPKLMDMFMGQIKVAGNLKDPEKIETDLIKKRAEVIKKMSVDVDFCVIKCIGLKEDDQPARIVTLDELLLALFENIKIKSEISEEFQRRHFFRVITFNGKKFDLPILIRECIRREVDLKDDKHGVEDSVLRHLRKWMKRFDIETSIDLMEILGDGDYKSLDLYSQIYLDWPKKEIDFETCSQSELEAHCVDDVEITAALYNKFKTIL